MTANQPQNPAISIRKAKIDDAVEMHRMLKGIAEATGCEDKFASTPDDLTRDGFGPTPAFEALILIADGKASGLCVYFPSYSTFRGKAGIYVQDFYIDPALRGGGFARSLFAAVATQAQQDNRHYIRLSVDAENIAGQKFYRKIGMRQANDERIFVIDGDGFKRLAAEGK